AFADPLAQRIIARAGRRAGEDQVAEPAQARERLALGAAGEAEAGHFGEAAADQCGPRILAEPFAFDHAAGDREHILDRPADLGPGDIVRQIDPEGRLADGV